MKKRKKIYRRNWTPRVESKKFQEIKKKVKARDKSICGLCGKYRSRGEIHHIRKWADNPYLRYEERNLIYLDFVCHKKIKGCEDSYIPIFENKIREKYS